MTASLFSYRVTLTRDEKLSKKTDLEELPPTLRDFIKSHPEVWSAHEKLGIESVKAGPLSEKQVQLIKLAVTGSQMLETAFKTHVRKAVGAGATRAEIEHAIIQLLPLVGMGRMMMAMKWYQESLRQEPT
jgi:alkylhydroperoxidase/carboxymuconolactone decarboxylase family protein YurZ